MTDSYPVDLWVPCEHGRTESHQTYLKGMHEGPVCRSGHEATDAEVIARLRQVEGVIEVEADELTVLPPNKACIHKHNVEPGTYLVVPVPDSRKEEW